MFNNLNNREYARLNSLILIKIILEAGQSVEGLIDNIGFGGVKLRLPVTVGINQVVTLQIVRQELQFSIRAKCVWATRDDAKPAECYAGFNFLDDDIATYEKLRALLNQISDNAIMDL